MTAKNFVNALWAFARRKPFQPFLIELFTGERLPIKHPEIAVLHGEVLILVDRNLRYRVFDAASVNQVLDPPES